jgi:hypothetical protein
MTDSLRDRIAAVLQSTDRRMALEDEMPIGLYYASLADAVIEALGQEWRADFGYDGYARCDTREEAKEQVDDFNAALGDDVRDGEQAMVMYRYVTEWEPSD